MKTVYLAHMLRGADEAETQRNRVLAARWATWVAIKFHVAVSADWIWMSEVLPETPRNRQFGLEFDRAHIRRCEEFWMVGPKATFGMREGAMVARTVWDFTGMSPGQIVEALTLQQT